MKLKREWKCKCGHPNDPAQEEYSWRRCSVCDKKRWPWLWWAVGGLVTLVAVIVLLSTSDFIFPDPEKAFTEQCRKYLEGVEGKSGEITQREQDRIDRIGKKLGIARQEMDAICERVKKETAEGTSGTTTSPSDPNSPEQSKPIPLQKAIADAKQLLEQGRFRKADLLLLKYPDSPEAVSLHQSLEMPLRVEVGMQYQRTGEKPSAIFSLEHKSLKSLVLTHMDNYRLFFACSDTCYLQIFQIDGDGKVARLFPNLEYNLKENPIEQGIRYPSPSKGDDWFYLAELPNRQTSINETIYLVAARWPAIDLVEAYGSVIKATTETEREKAFQTLMDNLRFRKDYGFPGVFFQEITFLHQR